MVYDRNYITNGILRQHGITVLEMPSSELSRGRGGPRCMSMPLERIRSTCPTPSTPANTSGRGRSTSLARSPQPSGVSSLENHPDYKGQVPFYYRREEPFSIEGGDILNLTAETLAVGISQRTTPEGIEGLASRLFADAGCQVRRILALDIGATHRVLEPSFHCSRSDATRSPPPQPGLLPRRDPLSSGPVQGIQEHEAQRRPPPLFGGQEYCSFI